MKRSPQISLSITLVTIDRIFTPSGKRLEQAIDLRTVGASGGFVVYHDFYPLLQFVYCAYYSPRVSNMNVVQTSPA
jgi:hypothetical protein